MNMMVLRMLPVTSGKRIPLRLDEPTWQAIDWLANQNHTTWQDWCKAVIQNVDEGNNLTASIREASMSGLLQETIFARRGDDLVAMNNNSLTRNNGVLDDEGLKDFLGSSIIQGESDFGGFSIIFGVDQSGDDFLVVKNGLRDHPHFITVTERK